MADIQSVIQGTLDELVDSGEEEGLQAAVYLEGELVADCVAGVVAQDSDTAVCPDTLFTIFSASKGIVSTAFHMLVERGLLDYDKLVAHYWPEFGAAGKESITIAQVLNHTAGIPQVPVLPDVSFAALCSDLERSVEETAKLAPIFAPGTTSCYHGLTIGWALAGLVQRVDGRTLGQIVREEIAAPLRIADELYLGTPAEVHGRMATLYDAPINPDDLPEFDPDSIIFKVIPLTDEPLGALCNRPEIRSAELPAANISATARALAKHYAALVSEVDGVRLVSADHFDSLFAYRTDLPDLFMNAQVDFDVQTPRVLGYQLNTMLKDQLFYYGNSPRALGHEGYGGCVGLADPDLKLGLGFTKTKLVSFVKDDQTAKLRAPRAEEFSKIKLTKALYDAL